MSPITKTGPRVIAFLQMRQLGVAWMVAVIIGATLISANPTTNPQRLILPVAIMVFYGLFVYNRSASLFAGSSQAFQHTIIGQLADSMYFMGFVWTLWALIDSFVLHPNLNTGDQIFRTFGYALVTTATGMFSRLLILQFKYTATEQGAEAQTTVEDVLIKFSNTLEATRGVLAAWHETLRTANDQIAGANINLTTTIETTRHELETTITSATKIYTTMLSTTQERLGELITKVGNDLGATLKGAVQGGIGELGTTTATQIDAIKDATTGLVATLKRTNTGLGKSIVDLTQRVDDAANHLQTSAPTITNATTAAREAIQTTTATLNSAATSFTTTMNTNSDAITKATGALAQDMTGLADQIKKDITLGLTGITITPHIGLVVDETAINHAISPIRQDIQQNTEQTKKVQQTLENKVPSTPATPNDVNSATAKIEGLFARIAGHLEQIQDDANKRDKDSFFAALRTRLTRVGGNGTNDAVPR